MRKEMQHVDTNKLEKVIGHVFNDKGLMLQALTHSSYANEMHMPKYNCNERLEFLGDAVLELVSSEYIYKKYPIKQEGEMTKLRASMVCEPSLALCASDMDLGSFLLLSRGEELGGGRERDSITSDAVEAMIGAIYLDAGFEAAAKFIREHVLSDLENKKLFYDSKTILQEKIQAMNCGALHYELVKEEGPAHNKCFYVCAMVGDTVLGEGNGRSKKAAEQKAAYEAIRKLKEQE